MQFCHLEYLGLVTLHKHMLIKLLKFKKLNRYMHVNLNVYHILLLSKDIYIYDRKFFYECLKLVGMSCISSPIFTLYLSIDLVEWISITLRAYLSSYESLGTREKKPVKICERDKS